MYEYAKLYTDLDKIHIENQVYFLYNKFNPKFL